MKYAILAILLGMSLITPGCGEGPKPNTTGGDGGAESTSSISSSSTGGNGGTGGMGGKGGMGGMGSVGGMGAGGANTCGNSLVIDKIDPMIRCQSASPYDVVNPLSAPADTIWADQVVAFSSEYTPSSWSAAQATGAPNVYPKGGDIPWAWASATSDSMNEFITLGYSTPVVAEAIWVYETGFPSAISKITITASDGDHVVYTNGNPEYIGLCSHILSVSTETCLPISAVRIDVATPAVGGFNEIDAVGLIPVGASSSSSSSSGMASSSSSSSSTSSSSSSTSSSSSSTSSSSSSSSGMGSSSSSSSGGAMACDNPTIVDIMDPAMRCQSGNMSAIVNPIVAPADMVWADKIDAFSSEYTSTIWSAAQATGAPNVYPLAADNSSAWASRTPNGMDEFITAGYSTPVVAEAIWVVQTLAPGAISKVTITAADGDHVVYTNDTPQSIGLCSHILSVSTKTCSPISAVRVDVASTLVNNYNEIDAIGLLPAK